jgi:hypothetical protein
MQQQGKDEAAVLFRNALLKLREGTLTLDSWRLLNTCVANNLPPAEVDLFKTALQVYFTNKEVD